MNIIDHAIERLIAGGDLCKDGTYGDIGGSGPVCVYGAVIAVRDRFGLRGRLVAGSAFTKVVRQDHPEWGYVEFNDHPGTSLEDVVLMMKKASALLDEQTEAAS